MTPVRGLFHGLIKLSVSLIFVVAFIGELQAAGPLCDDPKTPWQCGTGTICYSDVQRCNGVNDCGDFTDESNCTSIGVTKHLIIYNKRSGQANLAWLITPVILGIGLLYALYKCFNEGLCHMRRMRMRRLQEAEGSYFALDQISFFSMGPLQRTALGSPGNQLMVVHNHHFSLTMSDPLPPPHTAETPHTGLTPPPTYAEAMNPGISNAGFAAIPQEDPDLPPYKELPTPPPPITPPPISPPPALTPPPISPPPAFAPRSRLRAASAPSRTAMASQSQHAPTSPLSTTSRLFRMPPASLSTRSRHMSDSPSVLRSPVTPTVASPGGLPLVLPWVLPTSSRMSPSFVLPPVSPLLPPPPPSPRRQVSVPSLQQLVNLSANRSHTTDQEDS